MKDEERTRLGETGCYTRLTQGVSFYLASESCVKDGSKPEYSIIPEQIEGMRARKTSRGHFHNGNKTHYQEKGGGEKGDTHKYS